MVFNITWSVLQHRKMSLESCGGRISSRLLSGRDMAARDCQQPALRAESPGGHWWAAAHLDFRWLPVCRPLSRSQPQGQSVALRGMKTFFEFDVREEEWDSRSTPLWFLRCDLQYTKTYSWMICMSSTCGTKNQSENHHHLQESIKSRPSSMICTTLTPRFGSSCSRGWCFSMHVTDIFCYYFMLFTWYVSFACIRFKFKFCQQISIALTHWLRSMVGKCQDARPDWDYVAAICWFDISFVILEMLSLWAPNVASFVLVWFEVKI